jgi:hypothetical protein
VWPFVGHYGLWLAWRQAGSRWLVGGGFVALPVLWLGPEWWGSGDPLRAMHRAQNPRADSPAFADDPIVAVLDQFASMFTPMAVVGVVAFIGVLVARRAPDRQSVRLALALLAGGALWVAEVAVMTSDGFSGNVRYLVLPAAIGWLIVGAGVAWLVRALAGERAMRGAAGLVTAAAVTAVVSAGSVERVPQDIRDVTSHARVNDGLSTALARAGGAQSLLACGDPFTGPFQVPVVAWHLGVHTTQVGLNPRPPAVILRVWPHAGVPPSPRLDSTGAELPLRTIGTGGGWHIAGACRPQP